MKKVFLIITVFLCFVAVMMNVSIFQSTETGNDSFDYDYHFVIIGQEYDSVVWIDIMKGVADAALEHNVAAEYYCPDILDYDKEIKYLDMSIKANVDGVIINGYYDERIAEISKSAREKDIPIVYVNQDGFNGDRITYVGGNNYVIAQSAVEEVERNNLGNSKIIVLIGDEDNQSDSIRVAHMIKEINERENMSLIAIEEVTNSKISLYTEIKSLIKENPSANTIICNNVYQPKYVGQALVDLGLVGDITVIGYDDMYDTLRYVKKGIIASSLDINYYEVGKISIQALMNYKNKRMVTDVYYIPLNIRTKDTITEEDLEERNYAIPPDLN